MAFEAQHSLWTLFLFKTIWSKDWKSSTAGKQDANEGELKDIISIGTVSGFEAAWKGSWEVVETSVYG